MIVNYEYGRVEELNSMDAAFNVFLKSLGIDAVFTECRGRNYLTIWVNGPDDVVHAREICTIKADEINAFYQTLLSKHQYTENLKNVNQNTFSVPSVYSFHIACISRLVRSCKQEIVNEIHRLLQFTPEYVFCHSEETASYTVMPGYYFIYANPAELSYVLDKEQNEIKIICDRILKVKDRSGFYDFNNIRISFLDKVTSASLMYGLSRED